MLAEMFEESLHPFLARELLHVADMLDPAFAYRREFSFQGAGRRCSLCLFPSATLAAGSEAGLRVQYEIRVQAGRPINGFARNAWISMVPGPTAPGWNDIEANPVSHGAPARRKRDGADVQMERQKGG